MEDIKQNCKECGHENPKKFMTQEYISHAPDCSQDKIEDIKQQFESNFLDGDKIDDCGGTTFTIIGALDIAEYFYNLAVKQERERIFKQLNTALNKHSKTIAEGGLDYVKAFKEVEKVEEELLTLINNN